MTSEEVEFQVSLPIDQEAVVEVELSASRGEHQVLTRLPKLRRAISSTLDLVGMPPQRVVVRRRNPLPVGTGMGSSTADVVAGIRAVAHAAGTELAPDDVSELAGAIEPSDGVAYAGIQAVARRGRAVRQWEWTPSFGVVAVVPGRAIETESVSFTGKTSISAAYDELLSVLDAASAEHDAAAFAAAATASARLNQRWVHNLLLQPLIEFADNTAALGVCVAHTGSTAGVLYATLGQAQRASRSLVPPRGAAVMALTAG